MSAPREPCATGCTCLLVWCLCRVPVPMPDVDGDMINNRLLELDRQMREERELAQDLRELGSAPGHQHGRVGRELGAFAMTRKLRGRREECTHHCLLSCRAATGVWLVPEVIVVRGARSLLPRPHTSAIDHSAHHSDCCWSSRDGSAKRAAVAGELWRKITSTRSEAAQLLAHHDNLACKRHSRLHCLPERAVSFTRL